ncbi:hypothetical protein IGB42_01803 [Andreprevotia sp. IGB-42]|uniref:hypothetical protein n=1 Tax=Andreprevotia sp. IGB-42 TaxID=2497473 RepID=UPI001356780A|nr:hypothetical protein [Andreprevotia sp. IGB-42]KAF0813452.1 hypothetical protein IGB42_01803 [Andreprevotia sp. IGB-42]
MTRPTPWLSAFAVLADWNLDDCPWPEGPEIAMNAMVKSQGDQGELNFVATRREILEAFLHPNEDDDMQGVVESTPTVQFGFNPFAPNLFNVFRPPPPKPPRYFRALVWNLENFTNDRRPRGAKPIDSPRNLARIAMVADLAYRMGADALLLMETGADVGQAMTHMATRWQAQEEQSGDTVVRSVEPLVSPATYALPEIALAYQGVQVAAEADKVRALLLVGEGYIITPTAFPALDNGKLCAAFNLLFDTSNNVARLPELPELAGDLDSTLYNVAMWCWKMLAHYQSSMGSEADHHLLKLVLEDMIQTPGQFLTQPENDYGNFHLALLTAFELANDYSPSPEAGGAEILQLLMLAWILRRNLGTLQEKPSISQPQQFNQFFGTYTPPPIPLPAQRQFWLNGYGDSPDLVATVLLVACGQTFDLAAHDPDNGAVASCSDGELLPGGLARLGLLTLPHAETYGVVYRPYSSQHLEWFFDSPFQDLGYSTSGMYGILHGDKNRTLRAQSPTDALNGRSALIIRFPVSEKLKVPFALHHNRYSPNKAIKEMDTEFTGERAILARLQTLEDEASMLALKDFDPAPLIVGDFNVPSGLVQAESGAKSTTAAGKRRRKLRKLHVSQMAAAGYVRRRRGDRTHPQTTLKVPANIARDRAPYSEPYDAVYQPFDFLDGEANVRSAAVHNVQRLIPPALLQQTISVPGAFGMSQTVALSTVVREQMEYIYLGIVRRILTTLGDAQAWLQANLAANESKQAYTQADDMLRGQFTAFCKWLEARRKKFAELLGQNLLAPCVPTSLEDWFGELRKAIAKIKPFVEGAKKKAAAARKAERERLKKEAKRTGKKTRRKKPQPQSSTSVPLLDQLDAELDEEMQSLFDEEDDEGEETEVIATKPKQKRKTPGQERMLKLGELFDALLHLEQYPDLRLWGAYRNIVSDHLPLLVEIDLEPGSS